MLVPTFGDDPHKALRNRFLHAIDDVFPPIAQVNNLKCSVRSCMGRNMRNCELAGNDELTVN